MKATLATRQATWWTTPTPMAPCGASGRHSTFTKTSPLPAAKRDAAPSEFNNLNPIVCVSSDVVYSLASTASLTPANERMA